MRPILNGRNAWWLRVAGWRSGRAYVSPVRLTIPRRARLVRAVICRYGAARAAVAVSGQQVQERPDAESFLGVVAEGAVWVDGVPGAPPGPAAGDVASGLQVGQDRMNGPFGDPGRGADVPDAGLGIAGDFDQHVSVPGQDRPLAISRHRFDDTHRRRSWHELKHMLLSSCFCLQVLPGPPGGSGGAPARPQTACGLQEERSSSRWRSAMPGSRNWMRHL